MAFLRDPVRDVIRPFRDSDITVTRQWYRCAEGAPTLGFPTAFTSSHWEPYPWLPRKVGEVYPGQVSYRRIPTPRGLDYGHVCGTPEMFANGVSYDPDLPPVLYAPDGIPVCCRPIMCCDFVRCESEAELGLPATQWYQLAVPAEGAPEDTNQIVSDVGWYDTSPSAPWRSYSWRWLPEGKGGPNPYRMQLVYSPVGTLYQKDERFQFLNGAEQQVTHNDFGITWSLYDGLGTGFLYLRMFAGKGFLGGGNMTIEEPILPAYVKPPSYAELAPEVP